MLLPGSALEDVCRVPRSGRHCWHWIAELLLMLDEAQGRSWSQSVSNFFLTSRNYSKSKSLNLVILICLDHMNDLAYLKAELLVGLFQLQNPNPEQSTSSRFKHPVATLKRGTDKKHKSMSIWSGGLESLVSCLYRYAYMYSSVWQLSSVRICSQDRSQSHSPKKQEWAGQVRMMAAACILQIWKTLLWKICAVASSRDQKCFYDSRPRRRSCWGIDGSCWELDTIAIYCDYRILLDGSWFQASAKAYMPS